MRVIITNAEFEYVEGNQMEASGVTIYFNTNDSQGKSHISGRIYIGREEYDESGKGATVETLTDFIKDKVIEKIGASQIEIEEDEEIAE